MYFLYKKKRDPYLLSNYISVSLLSCVGKIIEHVVLTYVYNYFHLNDLFLKLFLLHHSTVYQLNIEYFDFIVKAIKPWCIMMHGRLFVICPKQSLKLSLNNGFRS